ncbi:glycosyltransferase family 4 protein [Henriciella litoralis]|uniref:glycosyltransferase family 4 protein n=1 Tax=Henriciella litoralis TaxID=568102 RepID=UPI00146E215B|nr:glycosyltransferase family 4 protein [Henriciella litoralis]
MKQMHHNNPIAPVEGPEDQPPLEVALLTWEYPPIPTAKGRVACEVAHGLAAHGVNVRVFTMDREDVVRTDHERIEVIGCANRITGLRRLMRRIPGLEQIAAAAAFRECVHEEHERRPFDIIETTNWGAPSSMLMDCGLPVVVRNSAPHDLDDLRTKTLAQKFSRRIANGLEARVNVQADAVISNGRAHANAIRDWYDLRPGLIHMVTPLSVEPIMRKAGSEMPFPPAHARLRLAYIGDDSIRKGFEEALAGFAQVVEHARQTDTLLPELHLMGLENGALEAHLQALEIDAETQEQIYDYGRVTDDAMTHVMKRCHAVLAPSRYQSFGSVYHEAAAMGRPLIACAEDPTATEFVRRNECGVLARECTPEAIADAVIGLFADRQEMMEMRRAGLRKSTSWTRQALGARTLQVYRRAMRLEAIDIPGERYQGVRQRALQRYHA